LGNFLFYNRLSHKGVKPGQKSYAADPALKKKFALQFVIMRGTPSGHFKVGYLGRESNLGHRYGNQTKKSGTPISDFTNRCRKDVKNHTTVTDLNRINFFDLLYIFIFQQFLI